MHPGSIHFGIKPYASEILSDAIARFGLKFGTAYGGVTTLGNEHCTLLISDVEGSLSIKFSMAISPEITYSPFTYLNALVPGGAVKYPLIASDCAPGEEKIKLELGMIGSAISSGAFDPVLIGERDWIPQYMSFEAEYERLDNLRFHPPIKGHPEETSIRKKVRNDDLTWMDDVRRILAELESQS